jgi:23S rRNA pseudouridine1911/1915/1917 synthase
MTHPTAAMQVRVAEHAAGIRLDRYLADLFDGTSRAQIQRWIAGEHVRVDGRVTKSRHALRGGELIAVSPPAPEPCHLQPEDIPLDVLYEDADLLVINKPAGMVVHPGAGQRTGTLCHALLAHTHDLSGIGGVERPGIVHRLDKGTSGVMVVAKHDAAHLHLAQQFHDRRVKKRYQAVVIGVIPAGGTIDAPIGRHPTQRKAMSTQSTRGKTAVTYWQRREVFGKAAALCDVEIATGRTHQIRVHLAAQGHPLVGDAVYGGGRWSERIPEPWRAVCADWDRPALHAARLAFVPPHGDAPVVWEASMPQSMQDLIDALRSVRAV